MRDDMPKPRHKPMQVVARQAKLTDTRFLQLVGIDVASSTLGCCTAIVLCKLVGVL